MNYWYELLSAGFDGQIKYFKSCRPEEVFSLRSKNDRADPFLILPRDARLANAESFGCPIREPKNSVYQRLYMQLEQ